LFKNFMTSFNKEPENRNVTAEKQEGNLLTKYNSLIHILKGHEEFTLDERGIIISSNLEAVNITGYEEFEVIGKSISLLYVENEKHKALEDLERAARFKQCVITGMRLKKRDTAFWAKMKITALYNELNEARGYKVVLQDATHRALSSARVQTLRDQYLAIFNNPFVGTFKFRLSDFRIQMCNQKTLEIAGRGNSDDLYFNDLFFAKPQFEHFISLIKDEKRVEGFKFLVKDNITDDNWAVISARYFEDQNFAEGVLFDISEQHSQMIELHRVNTELDNFTYHASHDLRAPLTTILGLVNLARLEPENVNRSLKMIEERVKHLDVLLKDLTSVTHNNKSEIESYEFNFKDEVDSIINENVFAQQSVTVNVAIDQDHPYFTDPIRFRTILRNLISNAFIYKRPDTETHIVDLKVRVEETHVAVQLKDNGLGIEWSLKDRVWDMFFRATTRSTGTGLGLYIVRSMVEKLKGNISFESTANNGTTFLLAIPNGAMVKCSKSELAAFA
jgi:PAS domain S-box-containing protein